MNRVIHNFPTHSYQKSDKRQLTALTRLRHCFVSNCLPSNNWLHKNRAQPRAAGAYMPLTRGKPHKIQDHNTRQDGERPRITCVHG